jgi:hypothetical protein
MALSISRLSAAIKGALIACNGGPADDPKLQCYCDAMATEIINEIVGNAEVLPGTFAADGNPVTGIGVVT